MAFGLKIQNALVYGNVSGYTSWTLTGYSSTDTWGLVDLDDINNPTNSYKYDAMKQFSRYVNPGAQRINAVFENGKASIGGANELDTYNGLTVSAYQPSTGRAAHHGLYQHEDQQRVHHHHHSRRPERRFLPGLCDQRNPEIRAVSRSHP